MPADAADRPGTPQARHIHALLGGGQRALETLFPGFERDLVAASAVSLRVTADFRTEMSGFDPFPQRDFGAFRAVSFRWAMQYVASTRSGARG
jgi:hypothetical protein